MYEPSSLGRSTRRWLSGNADVVAEIVERRFNADPRVDPETPRNFALAANGIGTCDDERGARYDGRSSQHFSCVYAPSSFGRLTRRWSSGNVSWWGWKSWSGASTLPLRWTPRGRRNFALAANGIGTCDVDRYGRRSWENLSRVYAPSSFGRLPRLWLSGNVPMWWLVGNQRFPYAGARDEAPNSALAANAI